MSKQVIITNSEEETEEFAFNFAKGIPFGTSIALHGDLGAGKTVFSRGFAKGLGITEPISSPTFTIIQEYPLKNKKWFFHLDLYRIEDSDAGLIFGVDEYIEDKNAISLMEWAERIEDILPNSIIEITIKHIDETKREITIK